MSKTPIQVGKIFTPKVTKHFLIKVLEIVPAFNFGGMTGVAPAIQCEFHGNKEDVRHYPAATFLNAYELRPEPAKPETKG